MNDEEIPDLVMVREDWKKSSGRSIPLTIVTGWLGSGKSTLVQRALLYLNQHKGYKVAIIQNEFSSSGVENAMVVDDSGKVFDDFLELANGCVCCTVRTDFLSALEELLKRKDFDYVILECSGAADPGPLANLFWVDQELELGVYLDGIVCVVDAFNFPNMKNNESESIIHQVTFSDRLIINKMDLVDDKSINELNDSIGRICNAEIISSSHCNVDIDSVFGINAFSLHKAEPEVHHACGTLVDLTNLFFKESFDSLDIKVGIDLKKLKDLISWMLWDEHDWVVYRMKGVFAVKGSLEKYYLQAVCAIMDLDTVEPTQEWREERYCKLVIIGRNLNENLLYSKYRECFE